MALSSKIMATQGTWRARQQQLAMQSAVIVNKGEDRKQVVCGGPASIPAQIPEHSPEACICPSGRGYNRIISFNIPDVYPSPLHAGHAPAAPPGSSSLPSTRPLVPPLAAQRCPLLRTPLACRPPSFERGPRTGSCALASCAKCYANTYCIN